MREKNETIVCGRRPAPRDLPEPLCWYPVFNEAEQCYKACGKPAILVDHLFPVYWAENRCKDHADLSTDQPL